jgi:uncharacterized protein (DUF111 family)
MTVAQKFECHRTKATLPPMRSSIVGVCVMTAALAAGCGTSTREEVRAKVEQFGVSVANKDYKTLCTQVLAPSLVRRISATGLTCEQAMQVALERVHNPTLSIAKVTVHGNTASAVTLTGAKGQVGSLNAIELVQTKNGWRVSSLGSPVAG